MIKQLAREFRSAKDFYENNIRSDDEDAFDYFYGKKPTIIDKDVPEYFQSIVSHDVADTIEHTLADIMPAFASEVPVTFTPKNLQDEKQAQIETQLVNDIFIQQSNGFIQLTTACKDALLRKIGVIEVQTYEKTSVSYMKVKQTTIPVLTTLLSPKPGEDAKLEIIEINGENASDIENVSLDSTLDVVIRKTIIGKQLLIDAFPPDELRINADHEEVDLDSARFVARERLLTSSELIELGYDQEIVESLPSSDSSYRDTISPHRQNETSTSSEEEKKIRVGFAYYLFDDDGDGLAEKRRVVAAGDLESKPIILENEPCSMQPYCIGVPFIRQHRTHGVSLFDKIRQIQDVKTKVLRQLLTAGERAVRGRVGVVGAGVNMDDFRESVFGGIVRMTSPNAVVSLPMDRYPAEIADLLNQMDKQRREGGGSAVDKATEEIAVGGDTAHGLERMMSAMEQLNSMVAKLLAETLLKQIYVKIHANLQRYFSNQVSAKVGGNWIQSIPANWPVRKHVSVSLGLTMGDRMRQAQNYTALIAEQKELMGKGSILATEQSTYTLLMARANALMIPNAHALYIDPSSPEGRQAAQQRQQRQQQQQQQQQQVQMMNMELLPKVETIKAEAAVQVQNMRGQIDQMEAHIKAQSTVHIQEMKNQANMYDVKIKEMDSRRDYDAKIKELELKLLDIGSKYEQAIPTDDLK